MYDVENLIIFFASYFLHLQDSNQLFIPRLFLTTLWNKVFIESKRNLIFHSHSFSHLAS